MVINTKSTVFVNGRPARVLSHRFNVAVRKGLTITDSDGERIIPSKNLSWENVRSTVRLGKAVQARVGK